MGVFSTIAPAVVIPVRVMKLKPLRGNKENRQRYLIYFLFQRGVRGPGWLQNKFPTLVGIQFVPLGPCQSGSGTVTGKKIL